MRTTDVPLNLTETRGPSVWDATPPARQPAWQNVATTTGLMLVAAGWPFRSRSGRLMAAAGLVGVVLGLTQTNGRNILAAWRDWATSDPNAEARMDSTLADSFPASDPPSH